MQETNNAYSIGTNNTNLLAGIIYNTPSAVFPVRHADGTYGGNSTYGANNPVALLESTGNYRTTYGTLLANATLKQELDALLKGLSAEVSVAFDNSGSMYDTATKEYKYMDTQASMLPDGTLVTTPVIYGKIRKPSITATPNSGHFICVPTFRLKSIICYKAVYTT